MSAFWACIIAAGAAILSSALTSYWTHYFERKISRVEYELNWLEERFTPALDFLGSVSAIISSTPNTQEERKQMADEIRKMVVGPSKENNAWCIAVLLDPEETGLSARIHEAMSYARIAESDEEFTKYWTRVHSGFRTLAEELHKERQAIVSGGSLKTLIQSRKRRLEEDTQRMIVVLRALKDFLDGKANLDSTLRGLLQKIQASGVRGARPNWALEIVSNAGDQQKQSRFREVRRVCEEAGLVSG